MSWKCSSCGFDNESTVTVCASCAAARPAKLKLLGPDGNGLVTAGITTEVGRRLLSKSASDEIRFVSDPQFKLIKDPASGTWQIYHVAEAKNMTHLNGTPLGDQTLPLEDGSVVTVGPDKMKLTVQFDYGA